MKNIFRCAVTLVMIIGLAGSVRAVTTSGVVSSSETWSGTITLTGDVICTSAVTV
jgi:hypothetical protein